MNTLTCLFLAALMFQGQTPPPPPPPPDEGVIQSTGDAGLAEPYLDGSYGFTIRPPVGWQVRRVRTKVGSAVTVLDMIERIQAYQSHALSLQRTSGIEGDKIDTVLQRSFEALSAGYSDVNIEPRRIRTISGRPGQSVAATYMGEGEKMLRIQAGVEMRSRQFLMLVYQGPASVRATAEPLFDRVLDSLTLVPDAFDAETLRAAGEEGFLWLKNVGGISLRKAIVPETYYRVESGGKVVGFMAVAENEVEHEKRPGVEIRERYWTFSPDGIVQRIQTNAFISFDLRHEDWKDSACTLVPGKGGEPARLLASMEEAVRLDNVLLSTQAYGLGEGSTANPPFQLPPTYLSRPMARMFPRLTSRLDKPRIIALGIFDQARSDIIMRIVDLKGESPMPGGSAAGPTYRIDQRDGPASPASISYVDENGHILLIKAGGMTMRPTTRDAVERQFAGKLIAAEKAMAAEEAKYQKEFDRVSKQTDPNAPVMRDHNTPREKAKPTPAAPPKKTQRPRRNPPK